ncbi:MAG: hypothetical protein DYG89_25030 [Caldilinea sp. CFX5]|nr:hypothetical protein [Caldilinea sp. CFX5]
MTSLILKIFLTLLIGQALVKFAVFFLLGYETRRKMLDAQYADKTTATKTMDLLLLGIVLLLLALLFASGQVEYVSFAVGLYAGMTLIQTYFHQFSKPLPPAEAPPPPVSPIKMMSYAIQANPEKPWKELLVITVLFVWVLYQLATAAFGLW